MARKTTLNIHLEILDHISDSISMVDLSEILCLLELSFLSAVEESEGDAQFILSEYDAEESSITVAFNPAGKPAIIRVCDAIVEEDTSGLSINAARFLYELHQKLISVQCELHWEPKRNLVSKNCYLSAEVKLQEPPTHIAHGTTTLQGRLVRIGGDVPEITLELLSGQFLNCRVTEKMALEIAPQLYKTIALHGRVSWETDEMTVRAFQPLSVTTYRKQSIRKSFEQVLSSSHKRWKDVDAKIYVQELREGGQS